MSEILPVGLNIAFGVSAALNPCAQCQIPRLFGCRFPCRFQAEERSICLSIGFCIEFFANKLLGLVKVTNYSIMRIFCLTKYIFFVILIVRSK